MITEIPSASEFQSAGLNQIYLAWQMAMQVTHDYEEAEEYASSWSVEETTAAAADYWSKSQPILANAFGLIQQAMEMALKGRIAAISPYLLIARDPKEWPSGVERQEVPFSDFRTLDAADLVKVHNTFAAMPLDDAFRQFWDEVRRDRNKLMHSVTSKTFSPVSLIRIILTVVETLFSDLSWPHRLLAMEAEGKYAAYGIGIDDDQNIVMDQIGRAIQYLTPAENKRFFGLDSKRRMYVCPVCWGNANRDSQENWPALAQLRSKKAGEKYLTCIVCRENMEIFRVKCTNFSCKGDVIHEDICCTCLFYQGSPGGFLSGLEMGERNFFNQYEFKFEKLRVSEYSQGFFQNDETAIEHARRAMEAQHLQEWISVEIERDDPTSRDQLSLGFSKKKLGSWIRESGKLFWQPTPVIKELAG